MNAKHLNSEKGQAIVYLVIGLVVFLGFVAMAIDGGMALADRRHAQNAADAASLAGGGKVAVDLEGADITSKNWLCGNLGFAMNNGEYYAITRADNNDFTISTDTSTGHNYVEATCTNAGKYIDMTVEISATTPSNFLQLVFPDALHNEVEAVTRVYPRSPISPGNAIIALNDQACVDPGTDGGIFYSNKGADLNVNNGSIHSNGCVRCNGSPNIVVSCIEPGNPGYEPSCNPAALGTFANSMDTCPGTWTPPPETPTGEIDPTDFNIFNPDCSDPGATNMTASDLEKDLQKGAVILDSGLLCITGNLSINAGDKLDGTDITIYMVNGDFTINGTPEVHLYSNTDPDASPEMPGIVIYVPAPDPYDPNDCTNHIVKLNGTETSVFSGSILAPCSLVTLNGTGGNTYEGQIIGWNVEVGGDADLNLTYNENMAANKPTSMELYR